LIYHPVAQNAHLKKSDLYADNHYIGKQNSDTLVVSIYADTDIDMDLFDKLTLGKRYPHYIALIDGRIRFDETPNAPRGQIQKTLSVEDMMCYHVIS
jgi:hypothetical protein